MTGVGASRLVHLPVPAAGLVLMSIVGIQAGHACGKMLFDAAGPAGVVAMRVEFTAAVLLALCRPRLPIDGRSMAPGFS